MKRTRTAVSGKEIGHQILPAPRSIVPCPKKSIRSFRKTFKRMCRDAGVGEAVHDAITGHRQSAGASRANYGGMAVPVMFEAISKLDISFLYGWRQRLTQPPSIATSMRGSIQLLELPV